MSEQQPDSDMNDDKTSVRQEPNDDETVIRRDKAGDEVSARDHVENNDTGEKVPHEDSSSSGTSQPVDDDSATIIRQPGPAQRNATILKGSATNTESGNAVGAHSKEDDVADRPTVDAVADDTATILRDPGIGNDAPTVLRNSADDAATVIRGDIDIDPDATVLNRPNDDEATILAEKPPKKDITYVAGEGKPIQSRGNSEAGRLLKNRFVLEERVGSGGMGDVYKALDLRQQEAQERNPYIAIKILNEHFARHKDAFISLQREATRTRGIPHPNIMAVYDFDREGDTVFMSMELLDGAPLDDYLREHPEGVSVDDAWNIIDGICQGLIRAHGAGIVHSDFKPGNIYYTGDKVAKVFDFGIARAVSSPGDLAADGEKTVFDAGSLGALTPTYASYEMLTGREPTKSDDVYAVALVAYELFTGRHPYDRTPADKALEQGLEPAVVPFLKRRHWRALKKGLALKGEDRYQSIDEFYAGMFSEDPPYLRYGAIAAIVLASMGVGGYSYFYGSAIPQDLANMRGQMSADKDNLKQRLVKVSPDNKLVLDPNKWKFASSDWRGEIQESMARLRADNIELQKKWDKPVDPDVDKWKGLVLNAYLQEIASLRRKAEAIKVEGDLNEQEAQAKNALELLTSAQSYLDIAKKYFNFDAARIDDESSRLATALQFRQYQSDSVAKNIKQAEAREAAEKAAALAQEKAAKARADRDAAYKADLDEFRRILRCKGDIPDADLVKLNQIINGPTGLKNVYPGQFAIDKPGIVGALRGCIEQRVSVRVPKRARMIKAKVMSYLPGEPMLASIKIEDLDPCAARALEGNGIRNGNWCSDRLAVGGTGPEMVVVPASTDAGIKRAFAISRIEIKVSDYNQFCKATGCKAAPGQGSWPVTQITLKQAEAYARWLSDESGRQYRLPTPAEWEYAARSNMNEPVDENVNCTVDSRGVRLGERLQSALSGRPNHWGLYNFVGNAREWAVTKDNKVYVMGGSHTTPRAECSVDRMIPNAGKADAVTGFRLMRRIDG